MWQLIELRPEVIRIPWKQSASTSNHKNALSGDMFAVAYAMVSQELMFSSEQMWVAMGATMSVRVGMR